MSAPLDIFRVEAARDIPPRIGYFLYLAVFPTTCKIGQSSQPHVRLLDLRDTSGARIETAYLLRLGDRREVLRREALISKAFGQPSRARGKWHDRFSREHMRLAALFMRCPEAAEAYLRSRVVTPEEHDPEFPLRAA